MKAFDPDPRRQSRRWRPAGHRSPNRDLPELIARGLRSGSAASSHRICRGDSRCGRRVGDLRHAGRRGRRRGRCVCRSDRCEAMFPIWPTAASCSAPLSCPSEPREAGAGVEPMRPTAGRCRSPARRRISGSARRSRCSHNPDRVVVGVRDDARPRDGRGLARADHGSHRVDVGRVGGDDQARRERVPCDIGHLHQRAGGTLRADRRRREGGRTRPQDRAAHRSPGLPVPGRRLCRRNAGARRRVSAHARDERSAGPRR